MTGISIYISKVKQLLQSKQSGISNRKIAKTLEISRNKANEFGLIPAKILKDDKEEYIKSLIATREEEDLNIFRDFMTSMLEKNLSIERKGPAKGGAWVVITKMR